MEDRKMLEDRLFSFAEEYFSGSRVSGDDEKLIKKGILAIEARLLGRRLSLNEYLPLEDEAEPFALYEFISETRKDMRDIACDHAFDVPSFLAEYDYDILSYLDSDELPRVDDIKTALREHWEDVCGFEMINLAWAEHDCEMESGSLSDSTTPDDRQVDLLGDLFMKECKE